MKVADTASSSPPASSSAPALSAAVAATCRDPRYGIYPECPLCGGSLHPEHAHFRCGACGWRDSCCD